MRSLLIIALWGLFGMVPGLAAGSTGEESAGRQLAQQVYDRPDGRDMSTRGKMILQEADHSPRVREMITYRREVKQAEVHSLIRFTAPADIRDTGLLTLDYPDGSSDQWIYLPALDRSRRISANRKGGRFVGSDIFFEDLQDRKVNMDHHRLLGSEKISGMTTRVLESVPVDASNSTYGKRVSWIHEPSLLPLRIDYYGRGPTDQPIKRLEVHRIEEIQGYWTIMDNTMTDLDSGHQTRLVNDVVVYDRGLSGELFSSRFLEDPASERRYRP
ncbi:outer membrane lipoprotein-sorting protein [Thiohalophilus sp.]|uniref:outer membrane lipoprotein-sorting protein n=1 Tax=Thiohalophilus sp. TaxID=3028392 RepID=UPI002ACF0030|nr:outer membrane lipoprotein-sorting protein [Thiohalophilus sp.]MDZ7803455.1 outer membrane lipoprotein-sorting protein [Thiohalophilus sp.]